MSLDGITNGTLYFPHSENAVVSAKQKDGEPLLSVTQVTPPPSQYRSCLFFPSPTGPRRGGGGKGLYTAATGQAAVLCWGEEAEGSPAVSGR